MTGFLVTAVHDSYRLHNEQDSRTSCSGFATHDATLSGRDITKGDSRRVDWERSVTIGEIPRLWNETRVFHV